MVWDLGLHRGLKGFEREEAISLSCFLLDVFIDPSDNDSCIWNLTPNGIYKPSSFSKFLVLQSLPPNNLQSLLVKVVWKIHGLPMFKALCWEVAQKCVNTGDMLQRRRKGWCLVPHVYHLCLQEGESVNHLFIHCPFAKQIWCYFLNIFGVSLVFPLEIADFFWTWSFAPFVKRGKALWKYLPIVTIWSIWEERNHRIFFSRKRSLK